jgi:hypothetical protein
MAFVKPSKGDLNYRDSSGKPFVWRRIFQFCLFEDPADVVTDGKRFPASLARRFPRHELQELVELEKANVDLNHYIFQQLLPVGKSCD